MCIRDSVKVVILNILYQLKKKEKMPNVKPIGRGLPKFKNEKGFHGRAPVERNIRHCVYSTLIFLVRCQVFIWPRQPSGWSFPQPLWQLEPTPHPEIAPKAFALA